MMDAAPVISSRAIPALNALTMNTGTATMATNRNVTGIALGHAKFTVHPIHLKRLGTIARGSALQ